MKVLAIILIFILWAGAAIVVWGAMVIGVMLAIDAEDIIYLSFGFLEIVGILLNTETYNIVNPLGISLWAAALATMTVTMTMLPFFIAVRRQHTTPVPIFILCYLLGWTVFSWVAALFWAYIDPNKQQPPNIKIGRP